MNENDSRDEQEQSPVTTRRETGTLLHITGLWENFTKDGKKSYLSGKVGRVKVLVFPNERREKDSDPHWQLYFTQS